MFRAWGTMLWMNSNHLVCIFQKGVQNCQKAISNGHVTMWYAYANHIMYFFF